LMVHFHRIVHVQSYRIWGGVPTGSRDSSRRQFGEQ
jgi:hypothetical protein